MKNQSALQRGITIPGFITLMIAVIVAALFVMKIAPMYIEFRSVKQSMDGLAKEEFTSASEVRKALLKRMDINYVSSVGKEDIVVTAAGGGSYDVSVDYYVDKPLFYNLTISGQFDYEVSTQ